MLGMKVVRFFMPDTMGYSMGTQFIATVGASKKLCGVCPWVEFVVGKIETKRQSEKNTWLERSEQLIKTHHLIGDDLDSSELGTQQ